MSANVESMFYVRQTPWHGLGTKVDEAVNSQQALQLAGLDWEVRQEPMFAGVGVNQTLAENYIANVRSTDKSILGVVSSRYQVVQNKEAFEFTDFLLQNKDSEIVYETAGSLANGKRVWMLAKMPTILLANDETVPYLVFTNSHDGSSAIQVAITPIRVVCQNTLNLALKGAKRSWSTKHTGNIEMKLQEAKRTLELATEYIGKLQLDSMTLVNQIIDNAMLEEFLEKLCPMPTTSAGSFKQEENVKERRDEILFRYKKAPDLREHQNNAWGLINSVSDYVGHSEPKRLTSTFNENRFIKIVEGSSLVDEAYNIIKKFSVKVA
jgi:phage/plasmid-like protein (TIGR03299 family)